MQISSIAVRFGAVCMLAAMGFVDVVAQSGEPGASGAPELPIEKQDTLKGFYIPKDIDDCLAELDRMLSPEEKQAFLDGMLEGHHFGLGLYLRNNWGLWAGSRLYEYFLDLGITHPDNMSDIIVGSYWRHLTHRPIRLEEQIQRYPRRPRPKLMLPPGYGEE